MSPLYKRFNPGYWWFEYPLSIVLKKPLKGKIFNVEGDLTEIAEQILSFLTQLEKGWPPGRNTHTGLLSYVRSS
jgi:hypothetical protein